MWWDPDIPPGEIWDELIEQELANVSDVIVLWSATSIRKQWVKAEATEASQARGILVPAFIENVKPPLAFRQIQAAPLADWRGNRDHAGFQQLLCTIRRLVDSRPQHVCEPGFTTAHNDGMRRGVAPGPSSKRTANTGRAEFSSAQAETSQRRWTLGDRLKVIGAATALLLLGGAIGYAFQRRRKAALQGPSAEIGKQAARPPGCEPPGKRKFFPGPREIGRHD